MSIDSFSSPGRSPLAYVTSPEPGQTGFQHPIVGPSMTIGKLADNDLSLPEDDTVSRHHCVIHVLAGRLVLEDLGSRNGTFLNGSRISSPTPLSLPSNILIGRTRLVVVAPELVDDPKITWEHMYTEEGSIIVPPSGVFKMRREAFLVVDVMRSTAMVRDRETQLLKALAVLGKALERELRRDPRGFLKCTGDGFFATFHAAGAALRSAVALSRAVKSHIPFSVQIRCALHCGEARIAVDGDRIGQDVHTVFALTG